MSKIDEVTWPKEQIEELQVELIIAGFDYSPEEITHKLGVEPTQTMKKGEVRRADPEGVQPPLLYDKNIWLLKSELEKNASLEEHLESLLSKLRPSNQELASLGEKYDVEISIYGDFYKYNIGLNINKALLKEIANLNVGIDIDIFSFKASHLEESSQKNELKAVLSEMETVKALTSPHHDEADAITQALAIFEDNAEEIRDTMVPDLIWPALNDEERQELLKNISGRFAVIQSALDKSRILSMQHGVEDRLSD